MPSVLLKHGNEQPTTRTDPDGTLITSFEAGAAFYSGPDVVANGSYSVSVDGSAAVTVTAGVAVESEMGGGPGGGRPRQP